MAGKILLFFLRGLLGDAFWHIDFGEECLVLFHRFLEICL